MNFYFAHIPFSFLVKSHHAVGPAIIMDLEEIDLTFSK